MPSIRVISGPLQGKKIKIGDDAVIGRDVGADICLASPEISRRHCRIFGNGNGYSVEDLGSRNGTVVDGVFQRRATLRHGTRFRLGKVEIEFASESATPGAPASDGINSDDEGLDISVVLDASEALPSIQTLSPSEIAARLQTFMKVGQTLAAHTEEARIVPDILQCLLDIFTQASRAFVLMGDTADSLVEKGRLSRSQRSDTGQRGVSRTILCTVMDRREAVLSLDAARDERFSLGESIIQQNIHSMMCAPLIAHQEILGAIEVDSLTVSDPFAKQDLDLLVGVASQMALYLRNLNLAERAARDRAQRRQLERFFSPAVARQVIDGDLSLGGDSKTGVVMFCDIIGFTAMSERTAPAELVRRLNLYLSRMVGLVLENEGTVDKFGGD
ncbi:MAG: FHA domain-containing protein, partial [Lentisphaerae bacterium]|nr:FHA domain-containing protein [Lentisphaerota bacterium]